MDRLELNPRMPWMTRFCSVFLAGMMMATPFSAIAQVPAPLPTNPNIVHGGVSFETIGRNMFINQASNAAIVEFDQFNIGAQNGVFIDQPGSQSAFLSRVVGVDPSIIHGILQATGYVYLVNPNGVYFGKDSRIDVGALIASTLDTSNSSFLNGSPHFTGDGEASIENHGSITAQDFVALLARNVVNAGQITAGALTMGTPAEVTFDSIYGGTLTIDISGMLGDVDNTGYIEIVDDADPNTESFALFAGQDVNLDGVIQADGEGPGGGYIGVEASNTAAIGGIINAGNNSEVHIVGGTSVTIEADASISAPAGTVAMEAGDRTFIAGSVDVSAAEGGQAGLVNINSGRFTIHTGGTITANGTADGGGGNVLVRTEGFAALAPDSLIAAIGGGEVRINPPREDGTIGAGTIMYDDASINVRGGLDDGFAELSGEILRVAGNIQAGHVLFDPTTISFQTGGGNQDSRVTGYDVVVADTMELGDDDPGDTVFDVDGDGILAAGSVANGDTITFQANDDLGDDGIITVTNAFDLFVATGVANVKLILQADHNIVLTSAITADGTGTVELNADFDGSGGGGISGVGVITVDGSDGGTIELTAGDGIQVNVDSIDAAFIIAASTTTGDISIIDVAGPAANSITIGTAGGTSGLTATAGTITLQQADPDGGAIVIDEAISASGLVWIDQDSILVGGLIDIKNTIDSTAAIDIDSASDLAEIAVDADITADTTVTIDGGFDFKLSISAAGGVVQADTISGDAGVSIGATDPPAGAVDIGSTSSVGGAGNISTTTGNIFVDANGNIAIDGTIQSTAGGAITIMADANTDGTGAITIGEGVPPIGTTITTAGDITLHSESLTVGGATSPTPTSTILSTAGNIDIDGEREGDATADGTLTFNQSSFIQAPSGNVTIDNADMVVFDAGEDDGANTYAHRAGGSFTVGTNAIIHSQINLERSIEAGTFLTARTNGRISAGNFTSPFPTLTTLNGDMSFLADVNGINDAALEGDFVANLDDFITDVATFDTSNNNNDMIFQGNNVTFNSLIGAEPIEIKAGTGAVNIFANLGNDDDGVVTMIDADMTFTSMGDFAISPANAGLGFPAEGQAAPAGLLIGNGGATGEVSANGLNIATGSITLIADLDVATNFPFFGTTIQIDDAIDGANIDSITIRGSGTLPATEVGIIDINANVTAGVFTLGGSLTIERATVLDIAGDVDLTATGGDLTLGSTADSSAAISNITFSPGAGATTVNTFFATGDIVIGSPGETDLGIITYENDFAGELEIRAGGSVDLSGPITLGGNAALLDIEIDWDNDSTETLTVESDIVAGTIEVDAGNNADNRDAMTFNGNVETTDIATAGPTVGSFRVNVADSGTASTITFSGAVTAESFIDIQDAGTQVDIASGVDFIAENGDLSITTDVTQINFTSTGDTNLFRALHADYADHAGAVSLAAMVDSGNGNYTVAITADDAAAITFAGDIDLDGNGGDLVALTIDSAAATLGGTIEVAGSITLENSAGDELAVTLVKDVSITSTADGVINAGDTAINGAFDLEIVNVDGLVIIDEIGEADQPTSVAITASSIINVGDAFDGDATILAAGDITLTAAVSIDINENATIESDLQDIVIFGTVNGTIGGNLTLAAEQGTVDLHGDIIVDGGLAINADTLDLNDNITTGATGVLLSGVHDINLTNDVVITSLGPIDLGSDNATNVNGDGRTLTLDADGIISLDDVTVGTLTLLNGASNELFGDIAIETPVDFSSAGTSTLGDNVTVTATDGDVDVIFGAVTATANGVEGLTINAGDGDINMTGAIGATPIDHLIVSGDEINFLNTITFNDNGILTVTGGGELGVVTFGNAITADDDLKVNITGHEIDFTTAAADISGDDRIEINITARDDIDLQQITLDDDARITIIANGIDGGSLDLQGAIFADDDALITLDSRGVNADLEIDFSIMANDDNEIKVSSDRDIDFSSGAGNINAGNQGVVILDAERDILGDSTTGSEIIAFELHILHADNVTDDDGGVGSGTAGEDDSFGTTILAEGDDDGGLFIQDVEGDVSIANTGDLFINDVTIGGNAFFSAGPADDIFIDELTVGDALFLQATATITGTTDGTSVTAHTLTVESAMTVSGATGSLRTDVEELTLEGIGTGGVTLTNDIDLSLQATAEVAGPINVAAQGNLSIDGPVATTDATSTAIVFTSGGDMIFNAGVTANTGAAPAVTLTAGGDIVDTNSAATSIIDTPTLTIRDANNIGASTGDDQLDIEVETLTIAIAGGGAAVTSNSYIREADGLTIADVDTEGGFSLISDAGDITVNGIHTSDDFVTLTATAGSILDGDDAQAITGSIVTLTARDAVGAAAAGDIETSAEQLDVSVIGDGNIVIDETDGVELLDIDTANGSITIVTSGNTIATDVTSTTDAEDNDIAITLTTGDLEVGTINAGTTDGDVTLTLTGAAGQAVTDGDDDSLITTDDLIILAQANIGTSEQAINTNADTYDNIDSTVDGGIYLNDTGANGVIATAVDTVSGSISIDAVNDITVTAINAGGTGDVTLTAGNGILDDNVNGDADITGDVVTLIAENAIGGGIDADAIGISASELLNADANESDIFLDVSMGGATTNIGMIDAGTGTAPGDVSLDAGLNPLADGNGSALNIIGSTLNVAGAGGLGIAANAIETELDTLTYANTVGVVNIANTGALSASGTNTGTDTMITASSPLTIPLAGISSAATITLQASDDGGDDDHLTINGAVVSTSSATIELRAGTDVIVNAAVTSTTGTIIISADYDGGSVGNVTDAVTGVITATNLAVTAGDAITLFQLPPLSDVDNFAAEAGGNITFNDADDVTIATVDELVGINSEGGNIIIETAAALTINEAVDAEQGTTTLTMMSDAAGDLTVAAAVRGTTVELFTTVEVDGDILINVDPDNFRGNLRIGNMNELGKVNIAAATVTAADGITIQIADNGDIVLAAGTELNTLDGNGAVMILDPVNATTPGAEGLTINAGSGNVMLFDLGNSTALGAVDINSTGITTLFGMIQTMNGAISLDGATNVELTTGGTFNSVNGGAGANILLNGGAVDGARAVDITAGTGIVTLGNMGQDLGNEITSVTVSTTTTVRLDGDITTTGNQDFDASTDVDLLTDVELRTITAGNVELGNAAMNVDGEFALTINAIGDVNFDSVGQTIPLTALSVTTDGAITFGDSVTIEGPITAHAVGAFILQDNDAPISTTTSDGDIDFSAGTAVTLNADVSAIGSANIDISAVGNLLLADTDPTAITSEDGNITLTSSASVLLGDATNAAAAVNTSGSGDVSVDGVTAVTFNAVAGTGIGTVLAPVGGRVLIDGGTVTIEGQGVVAQDDVRITSAGAIDLNNTTGAVDEPIRSETGFVTILSTGAVTQAPDTIIFGFEGVDMASGGANALTATNVNSGGPINLNQAGPININGVGVTAVGDVIIATQDILTINTTTIESIGAEVFLESDTDGGGGDNLILTAGQILGDDVHIQANGSDVTLTVDPNNTIGGLIFGNSAAVAVNGGTLTARDDIDFSGMTTTTTLGADTTINSTTGDVLFGGDILGTPTLAINAGTAIANSGSVVLQAVGGVTDPLSLSVTADNVDLNGNIQTGATGVLLTGVSDVNLTNDVEITSLGPIDLGSDNATNVNGDDRTLTLDAVGIISLDDVTVGTLTLLSGASNELFGDIAIETPVDFSSAGTSTLGDNVTVTATDTAVDVIFGAVTATGNSVEGLTINAGDGDINMTGAIGAMPIDHLIVSGDEINFLNTITFNENGILTVTGGDELGVVTFGNAITADDDLKVNITGHEIDFTTAAADISGADRIEINITARDGIDLQQITLDDDARITIIANGIDGGSLDLQGAIFADDDALITLDSRGGDADLEIDFSITAAADNEIKVSSDRDIDFSSGAGNINAGNQGVVILDAERDILGDNTAGSEIIAFELHILHADSVTDDDGGVGSGTAAEGASFGTALDAGGGLFIQDVEGDVSIANTGDLFINDVTSGGNAFFSAGPANHIFIDELTVGGDLFLQAATTITGTTDGTSVTAHRLTVESATTVSGATGSLRTDVEELTLENITAAGNITNDTDLSLQATAAVTGTINVAAQGNLSIDGQVATTDATSTAIVLTSGGDMIFNAGVTANTGAAPAVTLTAGGDIVDTNDAATSIIDTPTLTIRDANNIGASTGDDQLDIEVDTLTIAIAGGGAAVTGNSYIHEADGLTIADVDTDGQFHLTSTANNIVATSIITSDDEISLTAADSVSAATITAGTAPVSITATTGSITDDDDTQAITGSIVTLTAQDAVGADAADIETSAEQLDVSVTGDGHIVIDETDGVELLDIDTANGSITIVTSGNTIATDVTSTTDDDANDIAITLTTGDLEVGTINAGTTDGDVTLTLTGAAGQAVTDGDDNSLITTDDLIIQAQTNIGTSEQAINTNADTYDNIDSTVDGGIYLHDITSVTATAVNTVAGDIDLSADTDLTATSVGATSGAIAITTGNDSILASVVSGDDNVTVTAGNNITGDAAADVDVTGETLTFIAENDIGAADIANYIGLNASEEVNATNNTTANSDQFFDGSFGAGFPVGLLDAGAGNVTLSSATTAITDANESRKNVIGNNLVIDTVAGIGTLADAIETSASSITVTVNTADDVRFANMGDLTLPLINNDAAAGDVIITNMMGDINITGQLSSGDDIEVRADDDGGDDDNITVSGTVVSDSGTGEIILEAGNDLTVNAPVTSANGIVILQADFDHSNSGALTDGAGGIVTTSGLILGGNTVNIDADSTLITLAGDARADFTFSNDSSYTVGTVSPAARDAVTGITSDVGDIDLDTADVITIAADVETITGAVTIDANDDNDGAAADNASVLVQANISGDNVVITASDSSSATESIVVTGDGTSTTVNTWGSTTYNATNGTLDIDANVTAADALTFSSSDTLTVAGGFAINAEHAITFTDALTVDGDGGNTLTIVSDDADVNFNGIIDEGGANDNISLSVTADSGKVDFNDIVGGTRPLDTVTVAAEDVEFNNNVTAAISLVLTDSDNVVVTTTDPMSLTATAGNIMFGDNTNLDGAGINLTLTAGNDINLGNTGEIAPLGSLDVNAVNDTVLNGDITVVGLIDFAGSPDVDLADNVSIASSSIAADTDIIFGTDIDGAFVLELTNVNGAVTLNNVGQNIPLDGLTVQTQHDDNGDINLNGNVNTIGHIDIDSADVFTLDNALASANGDIDVSGDIVTTTAAGTITGAGDINIDATVGAATINAAVDSTNSDVEISAATDVTLNADIDGDNVVANANGGDVTVTAALNNERGGYDFAATGTVILDNDVLANDAIDLQGDIGVTVNTDTLTSGTDMTITGAIALNAASAWTSTNGDIFIANGIVGDNILATVSNNGTTSLNAIDVDQLTVTGDAAELRDAIISDNAVDILSASGTATLLNDIMITTTDAGGSVTLGALEGPQTLTIDAETTVTLADADIDSLSVVDSTTLTFAGDFEAGGDVTANTSILGTIIVDGSIDADGTVTLDNNAAGGIDINGAVNGGTGVTLDADAGNVAIDATVGAHGDGIINIDADTGDVRIGEDATGSVTSELGTIDIAGDDIVLGDDTAAATSGYIQSDSGNVDINPVTLFTMEAGSLADPSQIQAGGDLDIGTATTTAATIAGDGLLATGEVDVDATDTINVNGAVTSTTDIVTIDVTNTDADAGTINVTANISGEDVTVTAQDTTNGDEQINVTSDTENLIGGTTFNANEGTVDISANVTIADFLTVSGDESILVSAGDGGGNHTILAVDDILFSDAVTVDGTDDTILTVESLTRGVRFSGTLNDDGANDHSVVVNAVSGTADFNAEVGGVNPLEDLTVAAHDVILNADVTADDDIDATGSDDVLLTSDVILTSNDILFGPNTNVDGAQSLKVDATASSVLGNVGDITPLTNLDVDGATVTLHGDITVAGGIDFIDSAAILVGDDASITSTTAGTITFASGGTLDGGFDLTITDVDGDIDFGLTVGGITPLDSLTLQALANDHDVNVTAGSIITTGDVVMEAGGHVDVDATVTSNLGSVSLTGGNDVEIAATITGNNGVELRATDVLEIKGNISAPAGGVDGTGASVDIDNTVTAAGDIDINATTTVLDVAAVITSNQGNVALNAMTDVNLGANVLGDNVTVQSSTTDVNVTSALDNTLGSLDISAANSVDINTTIKAADDLRVQANTNNDATGAILLGDSLTSETDMTLTGDVTLDGDAVLTSGDGNIFVANKITGVANTLSLAAADGTVSINETSTLSLAVHADGAELRGNITTAAGNVNIQDALATDGQATILNNITISTGLGTVGNIVLGDLDGTSDLALIAGAGDITLDGDGTVGKLTVDDAGAAAANNVFVNGNLDTQDDVLVRATTEIEVTGELNAGGNLTVSAATIDVNGTLAGEDIDVTGTAAITLSGNIAAADSGDVDINNDVTLDGAALVSSDNGDVNFDGTITGAFPLSVNAESGDVIFNDNVGGDGTVLADRLAELTVSADELILQNNADNIATHATDVDDALVDGDVDLTGVPLVTILTNATIDTEGGDGIAAGDILFAQFGRVNADDNTVALDAGGTPDGLVQINDLDTTGISVNGGAVALFGTIEAVNEINLDGTSRITLTDTTTLITTSPDTDVIFDDGVGADGVNILDGEHGLVIVATGDVQFGQVSELTNLDVTAGNDPTNTNVATHSVTFHSNVTIPGNIAVTANDAIIVADDTAATPAIDSTNGSITFTAATGTTLNDDLAAAQDIRINGLTTLATNDISITADSGSIDMNGDVVGAVDLDLNAAAGTITLSTIGATGADPADVTVTASVGELNGNISAGTFDASTVDLITLTDDVSITTSALVNAGVDDTSISLGDLNGSHHLALEANVADAEIYLRDANIASLTITDTNGDTLGADGVFFNGDFVTSGLVDVNATTEITLAAGASVNAGGDVDLITATLTSNGGIRSDGDVTLGDGTTVLVDVNGGVVGEGLIDINAATVQISEEIASNNGVIDIDAGNSVTFDVNGNLIGSDQADGTLGASVDAADITVNAPLDNDEGGLDLAATGTLDINEDLDAAGDIDLDGDMLIALATGADITSNGDVNVNDDLLGDGAPGASTITSDEGDINFAGDIGTDGLNRDFTINAPHGTATIDSLGATGAADVDDLTVNVENVTINNSAPGEVDGNLDINATGDVLNDGDGNGLIVGGDVGIDGNNVDFDGSLDVTGKLDVTALQDIAIGANSATDPIIIESDGDINLTADLDGDGDGGIIMDDATLRTTGPNDDINLNGGDMLLDIVRAPGAGSNVGLNSDGEITVDDEVLAADTLMIDADDDVIVEIGGNLEGATGDLLIVADDDLDGVGDLIMRGIDSTLRGGNDIIISAEDVTLGQGTAGNEIKIDAAGGGIDAVDPTDGALDLIAPTLDLTALDGINVETGSENITADTSGNGATINITNVLDNLADFSGMTAGEDADINFTNTYDGPRDMLQATDPNLEGFEAGVTDIQVDNGGQWAPGDSIIINGDSNNPRMIDSITGDVLTLTQPLANFAPQDADVRLDNTTTINDTSAAAGDVRIAAEGGIVAEGIGASDSGRVNGLQGDDQSVILDSTAPGNIRVVDGTDDDGDPNNGRTGGITADFDVIIMNPQGDIELGSESIYAGRNADLDSGDGSILDISNTTNSSIITGNDIILHAGDTLGTLTDILEVTAGNDLNIDENVDGDGLPFGAGLGGSAGGRKDTHNLNFEGNNPSGLVLFNGNLFAAPVRALHLWFRALDFSSEPDVLDNTPGVFRNPFFIHSEAVLNGHRAPSSIIDYISIGGGKIYGLPRQLQLLDNIDVLRYTDDAFNWDTEKRKRKEESSSLQ